MAFSLLFTLAVASVPVSTADEIIVINETAPQTQQTIASATSRLNLTEQAPGFRIDAGELLQGLAGVQSDQRSNYAQDTRITLRGFGARSAFGVRGVLLRLDGIPLSMPDGQAQTSSILLDEPAAVQVIRGPLAALYGNAAGGVIDWRSNAPAESAINIGLFAGDHATQRQRITADWVDDTDAVRLAGARLRTDGPRPHNSAERDQLALRWYRQLNEQTQLIVRMDDNNAPFLQDPSSLTPSAWAADPTQTVGRAETYNTRKRIHHQQLSATLKGQHQVGDWHASIWKGWRDIEQYLPFAGDDLTSSGAVIDLRRQFSGFDSAITLPAASWADITVGLHWAEQNDRRFGYVNDFGVRGDERRNELGTVQNRAAYVLNHLTLSDRWQAHIGVRHNSLRFAVDDYYTLAGINPDDSGAQSLSANTWSMGLNYTVSDALNLFISRGNGFESPTLTELAYRADGTGLNKDLTASTNQQWELGLKWQQPTLRSQLSLFNIDTANEIVVDQSIDGRTIYTNAEQTRRVGVELEGQWYFSENWDARFSATYLDATYSNGLRLPGVAKQQAFVQLNWQPQQRWPLLLQMIGDYRGEVMATDDNSVIAPSHMVWTAAISGDLQWQGLQVQPWFKLRNLFDRDYVASVVVNQGSGRAFEPGSGREWQVGVSFTQRF